MRIVIAKREPQTIGGETSLGMGIVRRIKQTLELAINLVNRCNYGKLCAQFFFFFFKEKCIGLKQVSSAYIKLF